MNILNKEARTSVSISKLHPIILSLKDDFRVAQHIYNKNLVITLRTERLITVIYPKATLRISL